MADGAFSHADAAAVKAALARLRSGNEADADSRPSCASKVVAAVDASRKDLSKRRTTGCIYLKVQQELAAPHVLLRAPRLALPVPVRRRAGSGDVPFNVRRCAALARAGAQAAVPTFLAALLDLADCAMTQLYLARADFFAISGDYLIMPNPAYFDAALFTTDAKLAARTLAASKGFGLVAWWIHPELRRRSRFYRCHASLRTPLRLARSQQFTGRGLSSDRTPAVSVAELLRAGDACPYLYDASDLELQHARGLRDVEKAVFAQLQDVYGAFNGWICVPGCVWAGASPHERARAHGFRPMIRHSAEVALVRIPLQRPRCSTVPLFNGPFVGPPRSA
ncbi:hypothetical protein M885DRAFT_289586 [Pelagophyceae sp. CCMP2097]|nr:hypothetical protein M885DRAFT_289586 [Pelagophyceae sp. CCMP2097]